MSDSAELRPKNGRKAAVKERACKRPRTEESNVNRSGSEPSINGSGRRRSSTSSTSNGIKVTSAEVEFVLKCVKKNQEPYMQSQWRRKPWSVRPYKELETYQVAGDFGESMDERIVKEGLRTSLEGDLDISSQLSNLSSMTNVMMAVMPKSLKVGVDVEERCSWGIDCFTRRAIMDALRCCPELTAECEKEEDVRSSFIERQLLPALNSLGESGWDIFEAVRKVETDAGSQGNEAVVVTAARLLQMMERVERAHTRSKGASGRKKPIPPAQRAYFRAHPKGQGVVCIRPGGLPAGSFVAEYLGELYTPWRWFERQDVIKKRNPDATLPDFYNIQLERPKADRMGYGVMYVEGANKGNFASRLCHSCRPNCRAMSVCAEHRISNALFTLRHIQEGEELSWDYACVTESEKEYRAAVCLCGTAACRGSFLYYANSSSFQEVMSRDHNFLDRSAILLRASTEPLVQGDRNRLERHGIKLHVLKSGSDGEELIPEWLMKWAALVLEFIEYEYQRLPGALIKKAKAMPELQLAYGNDEESAVVEAQGVLANRLQNLVVTLDKAKYFLRNQPPELREPPLRYLTDKEVLEQLWLGPESVAVKASQAVAEFYSKRAPSQTSTENRKGSYISSEIATFVEKCNPATVDEAREGLKKVASLLRAAGSDHAALHDLLLFRANTHCLFTANKYVGITSSPVKLANEDDPKCSPSGGKEGDSSGMGSAKPAVRKAPRKSRLSKVEAKKYSSEFIWGQLVTWYKQTIYNPAASLSADRRGTLSLPAVDCCYITSATNGTYLTKQRPHMLTMIQNKPDGLWPTGTIWSFRNTGKMYGSPMHDRALAKSKGEVDSGVIDALLEELQGSFDRNGGNR